MSCVKKTVILFWCKTKYCVVSSEKDNRKQWKSFSIPVRRHTDDAPLFSLLLLDYFGCNAFCYFLLLYLQGGERKLMLAWQHPATVFTSLSASRRLAVTDIISCLMYNKTTDSSLPFLHTNSLMNALLAGLAVYFNSINSSSSSIGYTHLFCLRSVNREKGLTQN